MTIPNSTPLDAGVVDAFLRVLTDNTKATGAVESKLDSIDKVLGQQQLTLLEINREITAIRVEMSRNTQDVRVLQTVTGDHEQRLRTVADKLAEIPPLRDRIRGSEIDLVAFKASQEIKNKEQDDKLHLFDKQQSRILIIGGVLIIVIQTVLSLFIQPVIEKVLF